jgi:hypothetical protein
MSAQETITLHDVEGFARKSGTDEHGNMLTEYNLESLEDGPDTCGICEAEIEGGWLCLDGAETVCDVHVVLDESGFDRK